MRISSLPNNAASADWKFRFRFGSFWIGVEYLPGGEEARRAALNPGLKTLNTRRRWQSAFALSIVLIALAGFSICRLQGEVKAREGKIQALQKSIQSERQVLGQLLRPQLAGTRVQGIDAAFQSATAQKRINDLQRNMMVSPGRKSPPIWKN